MRVEKKRVRCLLVCLMFVGGCNGKTSEPTEIELRQREVKQAIEDLAAAQQLAEKALVEYEATWETEELPYTPICAEDPSPERSALNEARANVRAAHATWVDAQRRYVHALESR